MSELLIKNFNALLNYLEDIIRLGNKLIYDLDDHKDFKVYKDELIGIETIVLNEDETMITPPRIKFKRPEIPSAPDPGELLEEWLIFDSDDIFGKPRIINELLKGFDEETNEEIIINFEDSKERTDAYDKYIIQWECFCQAKSVPPY